MKFISKPRLAWLRQYRAGRELSIALRESLLLDLSSDDPPDAWLVRSSCESNNTLVEYVEAGDQRRTRFSLKLLPCTCLRSCQTVQVRADGAVVWMPLISRLLLRNAVRLFVLRYANKIADESLGN